MRKLNRILAASILGVLAVGQAAATTASATFKVKITITESCTVSTTAASDVAFGTYARTSATTNVDADGKVTVNCTSGTGYTVGLNGGANSTGLAADPAPGERRMKHVSSADYLKYDLYQDIGRATFWGNVSGKWVSGTGNAADQDLPVYGRNKDRNGPPGNYEDTVTATITW